LGFVVEKTFAGGRDRLAAHSWDVEALVRVGSLAAGTIDLLD
jgi:hypothetical protein